MNIFWTCKAASRGCMALALVTLLFGSAAGLPDDGKKDKKDKKKDSSAATPAPVQKAPTGGGQTGSSGSGKSGATTTPARTGESNTATRTGGTSTTNKTGETSATDKAGRRSARSEGTSTAGKTGETSTTDKAEPRRAKSEGTSTTVKTGDTGTANKTVETSTTDKAERRRARSEGTSTAGKTGETGTANKTVETSTTDKAERRRAKSEGTSTPGKTGDTGTANKTVETSTTDKAARKSARSEGTNTTGKTAVTNPAGKNTSDRLGLTRAADGRKESFRGRDGSEARFRRDGSVHEVRARGMTIIHGPGGSRRVVLERVDHSRVVAYRGGYGYVQRPFQYRSHEFASRTYFYHGRPYARYYQRYPYRGLFLEGYRPHSYYRPAFYGWAYNPWRSPISYSWGWAGNPWYGYYGSYFTPYPVYQSASFWLTDYFIAASLQEAYQQRADNRGAAYYAAGSGGTSLTPEVKQAIANEVQSQLALENSESQAVAQGGDVDIDSSGLPRILAETSPNHPHIFVVAGPLDVTDEGGQECGLTQGDVLRLSTAPSSDATSANLEVLASKDPGCRRGTMVSVEFADLQEMQNHMRASIDQGLQELQAHPGGLPAPPASGTAMQAPFAPIAPPADPNVASELERQARDADTAEQGVLNDVKQEDNSSSVADPNTPSNSPIQISLGQTIGEVVAALGSPKQIVNLGAKKIYVYPDMKITFVDGKVTDVQ